MAAEHHRKQAEAYSALAHSLRSINENREPAPIREIVDALRTMNLCVVPRALLLNVRECLDPQHTDAFFSTENQTACADALRDILHPHLAEPNPTKELPL